MEHQLGDRLLVEGRVGLRAVVRVADLETGSPLLRERRRTTSRDGRPIEYGDDRYRSDRVTFTIDNFRPSSVGVVHDLRVLKEIS